jgi:hypothetical protein
MSASFEVRTSPRRMLGSSMGQQDPKDVTRDTARDLLMRISTALAMTEAAYLEARRRRDL